MNLATRDLLLHHVSLKRKHPIAYLLILAYSGSICSPHAKTFQVPEYSGYFQVVSQQSVNTAHERNMKGNVWTDNDTDKMRHLLELDVDGILTDSPDRLMTLPGR